MKNKISFAALFFSVLIVFSPNRSFGLYVPEPTAACRHGVRWPGYCAQCSGATSGGGSSGGGYSPWREEQAERRAIERQAAEAAEAARQAEKRRIENEKYRKEKLRELQANWLPLGNDVATVDNPTTTVTTYIKGPFGGRQDFSASLMRLRMKGSQVPSECLRRAAAIAAVATDATTSEESAFLASQMALAMEGAPLEVIVAPPRNNPGQEAAAERLRVKLDTLAELKDQLAHARNVRAGALKDLETGMKGPSDKRPTPDQIKRFEDVIETASNEIETTKAAVKDIQEQVIPKADDETITIGFVDLGETPTEEKKPQPNK